jgi:uncharacterized membrane protein YqjE
VIHPLFTTLATQPGLLFEHMGAYAGLAAAETELYARSLKRRAMWVAAAVALGLLGLGAALMASLLAVAIDWHSMPAPWGLVLIPLLLMTAAVACAGAAQRSDQGQLFEHLKQQLSTDLDMLRAASQP